ncbi:hypothetical protein CEQ90_08090 [Lewinellaceae bacterium SD302]|nr:hypothetical protein CEQ90_08090 [Lewinellaceae bacterium SD302]
MIKSRIAPTPSGFLHRGNAFNFLLTDALVKREQGSLLLRIDDMDSGRIRPEYLEHVFLTIKQLGIHYDEGPSSIQELEDIWSQKHRLEAYNERLVQLRQTGLVYGCDCSRKQVAKDAINGLYGGRCRKRNLPLEQEGVAWRIDTRGIKPITWMEIEKQRSVDLAQQMGDFVIRKKDGNPAYQVCSLTDDVNFGISLIVRGEDLLESSAAQLWLAELIGVNHWLGELHLLHHSLLLNKAGEKLSKSAGAEAIATGKTGIPHSELEELKGAVNFCLRTLAYKSSSM